jgi:hypothetical protein
VSFQVTVCLCQPVPRLDVCLNRPFIFAKPEGFLAERAQPLQNHIQEQDDFLVGFRIVDPAGTGPSSLLPLDLPLLEASSGLSPSRIEEIWDALPDGSQAGSGQFDLPRQFSGPTSL